MACLGEASRFRLVQALLGGARCVTDLAAEVGLSQSCTTRHLQALESRRLVTGRREGKRVLYRIREEDPGLLPLLHWALDLPGAEPAARAGRGAGQGRDGPRGDSRQPRSPSPGTTPAGRARSAATPSGTSAATATGPLPAREVPASAEDATQPRAARRSDSEIEDYLL